MPWSIERRDGQFCVVKEDDGSTEGCHDSEDSAKRQLSALYASEKSAPERFFERFVDFLTVKQRVYKMENGLNYPASDYAFVPDESKPVTWKLRLTEQPGQISKSKLMEASNALVGNQASLPPDTLSSVKRRIRSEFRKLGVPETQIPMSVKASFSLLKGEDGIYRWSAIYSNNLRDDDYPSEIISGKSHENFAEMVKMGIVEPPELWVWHYDGARIGKATHVDTVREGEKVFAVAFGEIDPGMESKAEAITKLPDVAMSHGMPVVFIKRDPADPSIITHHITREISVLPRWAAANKSTGFLIKEHNMALTDAQKNFMASIGYTPDDIARLDNDVKAQAERGEGRELKEADEPEAEDKARGAEKPEEMEEDEEKAAVDLKKEIADALAEFLGPIAQMVKSQNERMASLEATIAELKATDAQKVGKAVSETPSLSLKELVAQALIGGDNAAQVDGRSTLAKSKPAQAPAPSVTGIPFLDKMMSGVEE